MNRAASLSARGMQCAYTLSVLEATTDRVIGRAQTAASRELQFPWMEDLRMVASATSVGVLAVLDPVDQHDAGCVVDLVDDAVVAAPR
jgi:hypothetical protein